MKEDQYWKYQPARFRTPFMLTGDGRVYFANSKPAWIKVNPELKPQRPGQVLRDELASWSYFISPQAVKLSDLPISGIANPLGAFTYWHRFLSPPQIGGKTEVGIPQRAAGQAYSLNGLPLR